MAALRILIADDHEVVRRGVRALLEGEPSWEVCGEAATGREAVELAGRLQPDVLVLDIGMPELNGLAATRQIRTVAPASEVLVLTMHESEELVRQVRAAGACGYVLKSDAGRDLVAAVKAVCKHEAFFSATLHATGGHGSLSGLPLHTADRSLVALTPRERQVFALLVQGESNKRIAGALGISVKTVDTHRTNIMDKLDLHSVSALIRYAIRNRVIDA
jgi:DNA-binding NarL/FixJ family response regulator